LPKHRGLILPKHMGSIVPKNRGVRSREPMKYKEENIDKSTISKFFRFLLKTIVMVELFKFAKINQSFVLFYLNMLYLCQVA